jgi:hypothetical protein
VFYEAGGVNPVPVPEPVGHYLSFAEREELMRLDAAGLGSAPSAGPGDEVRPRSAAAVSPLPTCSVNLPRIPTPALG